MGVKAGYNPPQEFTEEAVDSLVDIDLSDSTELWLIQLPEDHRGRLMPRSLVHYPEPEELKALETDAKKQRPFSSATSLTKSRMPSNPSQSMSQRHSHSQSKSRSTHTHTSRKSSLSEVGDASKSKASKRTSGEPSRFSDHSGQDSGRASGITISGSSEQSERKKSKKRADSEA